MEAILKKYVGQVVGANWDTPNESTPAILRAVEDGRITIETPKGMVIHYAMPWLLAAVEGKSKIGPFMERTEVHLQLQIYQLVIYSGGVGVAVSF